MTEMQTNIQGQLQKKPMWAPVRILFAITGLSLIWGGIIIASRYLLRLQTTATATLSEGLLTINATHSLLGREFKKTRTITPNTRIQAVQIEKRRRIVHLMVGFGFLTVGVFSGVHWILNGLGAGYPYLFLIGAGVIIAGIAIDLILNQLIPDGNGRSSVIINTTSWRFRLTGLSDDDAGRFVRFAAQTLSTPSHGQVANEPAPE